VSNGPRGTNATLGDLVVFPTVGEGLTTSFAIQAQKWTADKAALPLLYSYSYTVPGALVPGPFPLSILQPYGAVYARLPAGVVDAGNCVIIVAQARCPAMHRPLLACSISPDVPTPEQRALAEGSGTGSCSRSAGGAMHALM